MIWLPSNHTATLPRVVPFAFTTGSIPAMNLFKEALSLDIAVPWFMIHLSCDCGAQWQGHMFAMLALLHLNFSDSSPASWDNRQAASAGNQTMHLLNLAYTSQFCCIQVLITHTSSSLNVPYFKRYSIMYDLNLSQVFRPACNSS